MGRVYSGALRGGQSSLSNSLCGGIMYVKKNLFPVSTWRAGYDRMYVISIFRTESYQMYTIAVLIA